MGIMRMRRDFARHLRLIVWGLVVVFIIGIFLGALYVGGGSFAGLPNGEKTATKKAGSDVVVAAVSGEPITAAQLDATHSALLAQQAASFSMGFPGGKGIPLSQVLFVRNEALRQSANTAAVIQVARKRGLSVSNEEVEAEIAQQVDSTIKTLADSAKAQKTDPLSVYRQFMQKNGEVRSRVSEDDFRDWLTKFATSQSRDEIQQQLLMRKLYQQTVASVRVSDKDVDASFDEVKLDTIMVPLKGADAAAEAVAKKEADALYAKLKAGQNFATVKKESSKGTPAPGGPQWMLRSAVSGTYGLNAEKAIFDLTPNSFSTPVKLPGVFLIFQVTEKRSKPPTDLAKKRSEIRKSLLSQRQAETWREAEAEIVKNLKIESKAAQVSGIQAYATGKTDEAFVEFKKAIDQDVKYEVPADVFVAMCVVLAQDQQKQKKYDEAKRYYDRALTPPGTFPQGMVSGYPDQIYLALGQLAQEQKNTAEALRNYQLAGAGEDAIIHMTLQGIYSKMGEEKLAAQEQEWLDELKQVQKEQQEAEMKRQETEAKENAEIQKKLSEAAKSKPLAKTESSKPAATEKK